MRFRSPLVRVVAIALLLATLFAAGFVARLAARVEAPVLSASFPFEIAPLVALPLSHLLLNRP